MEWVSDHKIFHSSEFRNVMKKGGSELLHANYVARTNFQCNTTLQLTPTPLNSMSALRSQNNTTLQLGL